MASGPFGRIIVAGALTAGATLLSAGDLTGTWIGTIPKRERAAAKDVAFRLVHEGSAIRGKAYNDNGASDPIVTGHVAGSEIRFDVQSTEQAGNQINIVVYRFAGMVDEVGIDLTRERVSARNAATGDSIPVRRPSDTDEQDRARRFRSFRLERLFR